jgi:hypothetical protein
VITRLRSQSEQGNVASLTRRQFLVIIGVTIGSLVVPNIPITVASDGFVIRSVTWVVSCKIITITIETA